MALLSNRGFVEVTTRTERVLLVLPPVNEESMIRMQTVQARG